MSATTTSRPPRPRAIEVIAAEVPDDLQAIDRWLLWGYVWKPAARKYDKPPLAIDGSPGSSTNPATWSTYTEALAAYRSGRHRFDGLGFILSPTDNLVGIDLDHCRDRSTGVIDEWALKIVRAINSYTEASPSGTGLRILLRGSLPPHGRKKGNVETYQDGRYLTITGQHLEETPRTIETREHELLAFHVDNFGLPPDAQPRRAPRPSSNQDVAQVLERMSRSQDGDRYQQLHRGNWSGYPSQSEADAALIEGALYWSGGDRHLADQIYRDSGLYRPKWETHRGAQTLGERTIDRLLAKMTRFYEQPPSTWPKFTPSSEPIAATNGHTTQDPETAGAAAGGCPELEAAYAALQLEHQALQAKYERVCITLARIQDTIGDKRFTPTERIVLVKAAYLVPEAAGHQETDAPVIYRETLAKRAGVSAQTAAKAMDRFSAGPTPLFNKTVEYGSRPLAPDPDTGELLWNPETGKLIEGPSRIVRFRALHQTPDATLDAVRGFTPFEERKAWGGARPRCPVHPGAASVVRTIEKQVECCQVCNRELGPAKKDAASPPPSTQDESVKGEQPRGPRGRDPSTQDESMVDSPPVAYSASPGRRYKRCHVCSVSLNPPEYAAGYCASCELRRSIAAMPPDDDPARWAEVLGRAS